MDSFIRNNLFNLWLTAASQTVIIARTAAAAPDPGSWTEFEVVTQDLTIAVEETLCGEPPPERTFTLSLPVIKNSRSAKATPGLASWITATGSRLIIFLEDRHITDEDLSVLPATDQLIEWLQIHGRGLMPPGVPAVLFTFAQIAEERIEIRRRLAGGDPFVADVHDVDGSITRLTATGDKLRMFSGVRFSRVARDRDPDLVVAASAETLAHALSGKIQIESLIRNGNTATFVPAFRAAIDLIRNDERYVARLSNAAVAGADQN
jgi:hypothetical protein